MDVRLGLLFLFVLGASWVCYARQLEAAPVVLSGASVRKQSSVIKQNPGSVVQTNQGQDEEVVENIVWKDNVCTLCEEFATEAIDFLSQNKTQTEIVEVLHKSCSRIPSFEQQCITLVDYYVPLFFVEISSIQPEVLCKEVNLCQKFALISTQIREDCCGVCHHAVSEVLTKLKDPDTQCKSLVFEYGPLILPNTEHFLETTDVCTILHACNGTKQTLVADS
ncbi:hypothetical protein CXB51_026144 [Gossypium anomalum]|uniref:Pulmonary surfactant-associated protein B n=1 Tax=Gossypium anomalum TaxID=47600 RepID=A0A8J5YRZ3_9ROSI|nr:hypothetical protein CXB51_026144 [Gossypium anomalum]